MNKILTALVARLPLQPSPSYFMRDMAPKNYLRAEPPADRDQVKLARARAYLGKRRADALGSTFKWDREPTVLARR